MKIISTGVIILLTLCLNAQIESASTFLNFSLLSAKGKYQRLGQHTNWEGLGTKQFREDDNVIVEMNYMRIHNDARYILTLRTVMGLTDDTRYEVTKVVINSAEIYNSWMKKWTESGVKFSKDPSNPNKMASMNTDDYIIILEKRKIKDMWVYEISIIV